jgi:LEA14-like dessication related protein
MKSLVLLGFLVVTGCSLFVTKPEIAVKDLQLAGVDRDGIEMDFLLTVTNPNSYSLKLTGYRYNLLVSALPLAKGENHEVVEFQGNAVTSVRLPVRISFHDLLEILKRRPDPEHISYQLTAGFDLDTPVGAIGIPVDKSGTFAIPKKYRSNLFLKL